VTRKSWYGEEEKKLKKSYETLILNDVLTDGPLSILQHTRLYYLKLVWKRLIGLGIVKLKL